MKKMLMFLVLFFSGMSAVEAQQLKFQGFSGGYITYGKMEKGYRPFTLRVDQDPWHFEAKGWVNALGQTADLDVLTDEIVAVVSYFDQGYRDATGTPQVTGLYEVLFFVDDEPGKVKDVQFRLLPPLANDPKAVKLLAEVPSLAAQYQASAPQNARAAAEEGAVIAASADPWIKEVKEAEKKARETALQKARQDSIARAEEAAARARAEQAEKEKSKKKKTDPQKAPVMVDVAAPVSPAVQRDPVGSSEDEGIPVKKKKSKKGKKKKVIEPEETSIETEETEFVLNEETSGSGQGFLAQKSNRKKLGIGLLSGGGVLALYGIYEHMQFSARLKALKELEAAYPGIPTDPVLRYTPSLHGGYPNKTYHDIENEKKGSETRRNLGLALGALLLGGGIVIINF